MSNRSRVFLASLGGAILLLFAMSAVALVAYRAGRNSAETSAQAMATVVLTAEGGSVTVQPVQGSPEATDTPELETDQPEPQQDQDEGTPAVEVQPTGESPSPTPSPTEPAPQADAPEEAQVEGPRVPVELQEQDIDLLLEVWGIIDDEFDGQLPAKDEVTYSAIAGSLNLLGDEFTRFIDPQMSERMQEQLNGSFEGVGAFVDMNADGYLVIVRPMEGLPADRAGLLAGDLVTQVNGESVLGKSLDEITSEIKGPEGTEVTLTIQRESLEEPFDVTLKREKIEIPIVSGEMLDNNIAYVRLSSFSANAADQLEGELKDLLDQEPQGLILDLRDNPGGFLSQAVDVADLFLGDGVILYERDRGDFEQVFKSEDGQLAEDIKLVVLVNAGSASASEIVAGAIQDRHRGTLVGETTFGKGSVQQPHNLSDGSELRVTIARWYTPDNQSIDKNGITPDITVASPEEFGTENDTQLQGAIQVILEG